MSTNIEQQAAPDPWAKAVAKVCAEQATRQANYERAMAACGRGNVAAPGNASTTSASWAKVVARFNARNGLQMAEA